MTDDQPAGDCPAGGDHQVGDPEVQDGSVIVRCTRCSMPL